MAHLSEESLTLLALGEALDPQSREHVASCADCTAELASLQRVVHAGRAEAPAVTPMRFLPAIHCGSMASALSTI